MFPSHTLHILSVVKDWQPLGRHLLDADQIAQSFYLMCGFPPSIKLRDLRGGNRGGLKLGLGWVGVGFVMYLYVM